MRETRAILNRFFGFQDFRPGQEPIVDALAQGHDVLALMATGFGKSLCFQVPALCRPGVCVVVSPLIALMQDQVKALQELGMKADCLNHTKSKQDARDIVTRLASGDVKFFYCSPETLGQARIRAALANTKVGMFVIDEAHCISQWGHDFRPEYARLNRIINILSQDQNERPPRGAFTATATDRVRGDIVRSAGLANQKEFNGGVCRPNLIYRTSKSDALYKELNKVLARHEGEARVVYFLTIKALNEAVEAMDTHEILTYHGKMPPKERASSLAEFMKGSGKIVFATDAFGMGVDKKDIRCVVNVGYPLSIEHYVQQSGRAGRDGLPAHCYLIAGNKHFYSQKFFVERAMLSDRLLLNVWRIVRNEAVRAWPVKGMELAKALRAADDLKCSGFELPPIVNLLEEQGYIEFFYEGKRQMFRVANQTPTAPVSELELRNKNVISKAEAMRNYIEYSGCRAQYIEKYFAGRVSSNLCGMCQFCEPDPGQLFNEAAWKVVRTLKLMKDPFGSKQVQMILIGFRDTWKIQDRGHDKLETFGSLEHLGSGGVKALVGSLVNTGVLEKTKTRFPLLKVSRFGDSLARAYMESGGEPQPIIRNKRL